MKRFTETQKWDDPWFRQLAGVHKLVFLYIVDRCDNAGFLELDVDAMAWHTKVKAEHIEGALKGLERGIKGASGWLWVRRFLRHQKNESLNPENPAHKQIISLLNTQRDRFNDLPEFQEHIGPLMGLQSPIGIGTVQVKEKKGRVQRGEFIKPTIDQAHAYGAEIGMKLEEVDSWYDHFESNGWKVGGKAGMADWRAGLRNGKRQVKSGGTNGTYKGNTIKSNRTYGTANERRLGQYDGVGKVRSVPDVQRTASTGHEERVGTVPG